MGAGRRHRAPDQQPAPGGPRASSGATSLAAGDDPLRLSEIPHSRPTGRLVAIVGLVLAAVIVATWASLARIEAESRSAAAVTLEDRVDTMIALLQTWSQQEIQTAHFWAGDDEVGRLTRDLLATSREASALRGSPAQKELRDHLKPVIDAHGYRGFFIVDLEGTSLGSTRDTNIGTENLVHRDQPERMDLLYQGRELLTVPQFSDVPLTDGDENLVAAEPTMFVGAPIIDDTGATTAVLLFRIDVVASFSQVFQDTRWDRTGEVFAIDGEGRMLVASRFESELIEAGLVASSSFHTLTVRDPGVDLTLEPVPPDRDRWEPTAMAASAVEGGSGYDVSAYNSYLGYPVAGAWRWVDELGFAVAAEQSTAEAFELWRFTRLAVLLLSGAALSMIAALSWLMLWRRPQQRDESEQAAERARRMRSVLDQSSDGLIMIGSDQRVVFFNDSASALFGYERHEAIGQELEMLLQTGARSAHRALVQGFMRRGERRRMAPALQTVPARRKDGSTFPAQVFLSSVELGGGERLFTASVRDLTLDVNLRLVEQSMRELERFTSVAAHDLQEPLRRVETFSDLLVSSIELTSEEEPIVGSMVRAVRQMRSLVRDLLNYTTSTLSDMRMERIDLDELVGEVVAELRDRIDEAGASVEIGRLPTVVGDRDQLGQLFRYLIDNALKYRRPDVEATIGVSADPGGPGSDHHEIKVEDNGIGFEQQHAEQIFEVFRRLHPTGVYDGTGVGLAICRRIAERHGGSIRATGTPGGGAELVVELPVRRLVVADTAPAAEQAVSAGAAAR